MGKIYYQVDKPRVPAPTAGIQVNFCKNPKCKNFGKPAKDKVTRGRPAKGQQRLTDVYEISGSGQDLPVLFCKECGERPPIKSNIGIAEEFARFKSLLSEDMVCCQNPICENHKVSFKSKGKYQKFGKTAAGDPRYRCKACGKTFSIGKPARRQKRSEKNKRVFLALMNKVPIRRLCEIESVPAKTIYAKIDFLHQQCLRFLAMRERRLLTSVHPKRLYLSVDRQDHFANWIDRDIKKNTVFHAIGTADNDTGYVFGIHLNYDPRLSHESVEDRAKACGDLHLPVAYRQHARIWLAHDYIKAIIRSNKRNEKEAPKGSLVDRIITTYSQAGDRIDVEALDKITEDMQLPKRGVQIHADYTMYGHFHYLAYLLQKVGKIRFYLDQDSGIRAACMSAFRKRIKERTCDAFYVSIKKGLTNPVRESLVGESRRDFKQFRKAYPELSDRDVIRLMVKRNMKNLEQIGQFKDLWLKHPYPSKNEPEKMISFQTNLGDYSEDHQANLYMKATLHGIDRFFLQARRRSAYLERGIHTSSQSGGVWHGYAPYNPQMIGKLLDMLRFYYNYILVGKNKETPAMRLGLADGPVKIEDILYS